MQAWIIVSSWQWGSVVGIASQSQEGMGMSESNGNEWRQPS